MKPFTDVELAEIQAWYENFETYRSKYNTTPSAPIPELFVGQMDDDIILRLVAQVRDLQLQVSVAGTQTSQYFKGLDEGVSGVAQRWREALTQPIPKAGVLGDDELEKLYRETEALRVLAGAAAKAGG